MRYLILWLWLVSQLTPHACLVAPNVREIQDVPGSVGMYIAGTVFVEKGVPDHVVLHEYAHHIFYRCHIANRPVGDRFLRVVGYPAWVGDTTEWWPSTLVWVLTGHPQAGYARPEAAFTLRRWIDTPSQAQADRLTP